MVKKNPLGSTSKLLEGLGNAVEHPSTRDQGHPTMQSLSTESKREPSRLIIFL